MRKFITHVFRPGTGRTVPSATVQVKAYPSTIVSANVTVYSDSAGTLPIAQPMTATSNGLIQFYAPDGHYDLYFSIPDPVFGTITDTWTDVTIQGADTTTAIVNTVANNHYVVTENDTSLVNRIWMPTFKGHPDTPPAVANAFDNEFDAADGNWAAFNGASATITVANGRVRLFTSTVTTNPAVGFERTAFTQDTNFTLTALIRLGCFPGINAGETSGERPFFGLGIKDNAGNINTIGLRHGAQGLSVYNMNFSAGGLSSSEGYQQVGSNACYVRIRRSSADSTYYLEWSQAGFTWIGAKSITPLLSGTPVRMGLYAYASFDTGGWVDGYADFVRYIATSLH